MSTTTTGRQRASDATSYFFAVRPAYALACRFVDDVLAAGSGDRTEDLKGRAGHPPGD